MTEAGPIEKASQRILKALARPGARLVRAGAQGCWSLAAPGGPLRQVPPSFVARALGLGWLQRTTAATGEMEAALTEQGRAAALAGPTHRAEQIVDPEGRTVQVLRHLAESPLAWLARRKGPRGRPYLSAAAVAAGEHLREDFERARLRQRVTADLTLPVSGDRRSARGPEAVHLAALAARARVDAALKAAGPSLADILLLVCCHLKGLEEAEIALAWPPRSGKVILAIALERLAAHYGLSGAPESRRIRAWSAEEDPAGAGG